MLALADAAAPQDLRRPAVGPTAEPIRVRLDVGPAAVSLTVKLDLAGRYARDERPADPASRHRLEQDGELAAVLGRRCEAPERHTILELGEVGVRQDDGLTQPDHVKSLAVTFRVVPHEDDVWLGESRPVLARDRLLPSPEILRGVDEGVPGRRGDRQILAGLDFTEWIARHVCSRHGAEKRGDAELKDSPRARVRPPRVLIPRLLGR